MLCLACILLIQHLALRLRGGIADNTNKSGIIIHAVKRLNRYTEILVHGMGKTDRKHQVELCFQTFRLALKRTVIDKKLETRLCMLLRELLFVRDTRAHRVYDTVGRRCPQAGHDGARRFAARSLLLRCRCAALRCAALRCAVLRSTPLRSATLRCATPRGAALSCASLRRPPPLIILKTVLFGRRPTLFLIL